jgi:two-component system, sensor histidine kinase
MQTSNSRRQLLEGLRKEWFLATALFRRLPDLSLAIGKPEVSQRIARQQFRTLIAQMQHNVVASCCGFALVALCLWLFNPSISVAVWMASIGTNSALVVLFLRRFTRTPPPDSMLRYWEVRFALMSTWVGLGWGAPIFLLGNKAESMGIQMAVASLLTIVGALSLHVRYRPSIYWMALPCGLMVTIGLLCSAHWITVLMGLGFGMVVLLLCSLALMQNDLMSQTLHHAEERLSLLHELELRRQEAQQANQAKTRFLAAASHDLHQPIHSIALLTNTLAQRSGADAEVHAQISASVQAMDDMLNGLLEVSKLDIDKTPLAPGPVALPALLQRLQLQFLPQAQAKGIALEVQAQALQVHTDPEQLMRLLSNLLSNAIRFTSNGGVVLRTRLRGNHVWVQVWDSGTGIARENRQHVFEEFVQLQQQGSPVAHGARSVGLGLSIVRRIAQRLGHALVLRSRPGAGTLFAVCLPLASQASQQDPLQRQSLETLLTGKLVLLVEDDPAARQSMQWLLESCGCHVLAAASTEQALTMVDQTLRTPDLILSDYRLGPTDTGLDCMAQVRTAVGEHIPALLMTAERSPPLEAAQQLGVLVLAKPVQLKDLLAALKHLLND